MLLRYLAFFGFVSLLVHVSQGQYEAFGEADEAGYIAAFSELIKDSYSAPLPQGLISQCKNQNQAPASLPIRTATHSMYASELQSFCGTESVCNVPSGITITMNT